MVEIFIIYKMCTFESNLIYLFIKICLIERYSAIKHVDYRKHGNIWNISYKILYKSKGFGNLVKTVSWNTMHYIF